MILVFILFSFLSLFSPSFDFSSLRTHFWPLPFPSELHGLHGDHDTIRKQEETVERSACCRPLMEAR